MIQYADFGHYSTPGWCPNVQLYIKYKIQHTSFGQPPETISLLFLRNSLVFNILPQNKKILPPQQKNDPIVRAQALDNRIIRFTFSFLL